MSEIRTAFPNKIREQEYRKNTYDQSQKGKGNSVDFERNILTEANSGKTSVGFIAENSNIFTLINNSRFRTN